MPRARPSRPASSPCTWPSTAASPARCSRATACATNARSTLQELDALGVHRTMMLTGDAQATADHIAAELGITRVRADCLPADKVQEVAGIAERPVIMVGDGVNDAPVLAAADVGIAMGAKGATAASESADAVILVDDISRTAKAVRHRTRHRAHRAAEHLARHHRERGAHDRGGVRPHPGHRRARCCRRSSTSPRSSPRCARSAAGSTRRPRLPRRASPRHPLADRSRRHQITTR